MSRRKMRMGFLNIVLCSFGAGVALSLFGVGLPNHLFHTGKSNSLSSIIPETLEHPVNILVLGIDNSGHPHSQSDVTNSQALAGNSDTMLLVRLMPKTHQVNVLSIPRDTLVQLPDIGTDKINDANSRGGAEFAKKTVSHLLSDVPIDHYARIDTQAFIQLADALDGVTVDIPKPMAYDDQTQNLHIHLQAGHQTLTGQHLEEYVRFRKDELGDIGRVQRQQAVLKAVESKFWEPQTLLKLPQLLDVAQKNIDTDLTVGKMLGIVQFLSQVERKNINLVMLPGRFSTKEEYRASYWIEDPPATASILSRYFDEEPSVLTNAEGDSVTDSHLINVAVANNTGQQGMASRVVKIMQSAGFRNAYITEHEVISLEGTQEQTKIIAQKGNPEAANTVKSLLGLGEVQVASIGDIGSDVTVVIGTDFANEPKILLNKEQVYHDSGI